MEHPHVPWTPALFGDGWLTRLAGRCEPALLRHFGVPVDAPVEQLHLTCGADPSREVHLSWKTPYSVQDPWVEVGAERVPAASSPCPSGRGQLHHAMLFPLDPDTSYQYVVGHRGRARTSPAAFRTAPLGPAPFTFTVAGDLGTGRPGPEVPPTREAVRTVELVGALAPALHLCPGSVSSANGTSASRDRWLRMIEPSARSVAWVPAPREQVRWAGVLFLFIDGDGDGRQQEWLADTLQAADDDPLVEHVVVSMHRTAFGSSRRHGSARAVRCAWHDLFAAHRVSLVVQGDRHAYERSRPLGGTADAPTVDHDGVVYVTVGPGGCSGGLEDRSSWSAYRDDEHTGVVRVAVAPADREGISRLVVEQHRLCDDGVRASSRIGDRFVVERRVGVRRPTAPR